MSSESDIVAQVNQKVDQLYAKCEQLGAEKKTLMDANKSLEETIQSQQTEIKELHQKNELLKMAKSLAGGDEKNTEAKLKINELVREIDRCISLLNK